MKKERTIVAIGEPRVEALPPETADFFYITLLTRISELIQHDKTDSNMSFSLGSLNKNEKAVKGKLNC